METLSRKNLDWAGPLTEDLDLCYFISDRPVRELTLVEPDTSLPVRSVDELPLVISEPCFVKTADGAFRADEEGLYRLCVFPHQVRHVILFRENLPRLVGSIASLHVHGFRSDPESSQTEDLISRAQTAVISVPCGAISAVAVELMSRRGVRARQVSVLTMDRWNTYSCGHALYEYEDPSEGRWILADSDTGLMFRDNGRWLDVEELCARVRNDEPWEPVSVTHQHLVDGCTDKLEPKLAFYATIGASTADSHQVRQFCERVFQVPQIGDDFTVDIAAQRDRFMALAATQNLSYNFLASEEFRAKHYGY